MAEADHHALWHPLDLHLHLSNLVPLLQQHTLLQDLNQPVLPLRLSNSSKAPPALVYLDRWPALLRKSRPYDSDIVD